MATIKQPARKLAAGSADTKSAPRRAQGEPRRLVLEAARDLFSSQGFSGTSTREISERAGVSEALMYRYFSSKVDLFREALVSPFVEFVENFNAKWTSGAAAKLDEETLTRQFIGELFDLFRRNRGLVAMLLSADAQSGSELAESGVFDEISRELRVLVDIGTAEAIRRQGKPLARARPRDPLDPRHDRRHGSVRRILLREATTPAQGDRGRAHPSRASRSLAPPRIGRCADHLSERIASAAFSAIITVGALVLPVVTVGITEASTTRRP